MKRFATALLVAATAWTCGCSGEDAPEGAEFTPQGVPDVTFLGEGEGQENAEPLWTLRPGHRLTGEWSTNFSPLGEDGYDTFVGGPVEFQGGSFLTIGHAAWEGFYLRSHPSEPAYWNFVRQDAEGAIWLHGKPRAGLFERPLLWLPGTVRVGMKWESSAGGVRVLAGEVISREVKETPFGERPVWGVRLTDYRSRDWSTANGYPDDALSMGRDFFATFVEGRGPLTQSPFRVAFSKGGAPASDLEARLAFVPLEGTPPETGPPTLSLTPLNGGAPVHARRGLTKHASAYTDPDDPESLIVTLIVRDDLIGPSDFDQGGAVFGADENETLAACFRIGPSGEAVDLNVDHGDLCVPGSALTLATDGEITGTRVQSNGTPKRCGGDAVGGFASCTLRGTYEGADGQLRALATSNSKVGQVRPHGYWIASPAPVPAGPDVSRIEGWISHATPGSYSTLDDLGSYPLWIEEPTAGLLRTVKSAARLSSGTHDLTTGRSDTLDAYPRTGSVNVHSYPGGRTITMVSLGGLVQRVVPLDDALGIETLGDIEAPPGEFVTAALMHDDGLLVFTQRGFAGVDAWYRDEGIDYAVQTDFGEVMLYRAALPKQQQAPPPPERLWSLSGMRSGRDAVVCWDAPAKTVDDGWTLGGVDATARLEADGHCVLLIRGEGDGVDLASPSAWTVEGPVPDSGRVAIGGLHAAPDGFPFDLDPLWVEGGSSDVVNGRESFGPVRDGFFGTRARAVGPHGVRARRNSLAYEFIRPHWLGDIYYAGRLGEWAFDIGGHGLWAIRWSVEAGNDDMLIGRLDNSRTLAIDATTARELTELSTRRQGGGAFVRRRTIDGTDMLSIAPTGEFTARPLPPHDASFMLQDDSVCGAVAGILTCTSAAGVQAEVGAVRGQLDAAMFRPTGSIYFPVAAGPSDGSAVLERFTDVNSPIEVLGVDPGSVGTPASSIDIVWRPSIGGDLVGAASVGVDASPALLRVEAGEISPVACDAASTRDLVRVLRAGAQGQLILGTRDMLVDLERKTRIPVPPDCRLFAPN